MLHQPEIDKEEWEGCLTQHISAEFSDCLAEEKRYRCNYAFLFGDGYLCTHPEHRKFQ